MNLRSAALSAALLLSACKSAPEVAKPREALAASAYYPLAVGNAWTYDVGSGRRETIQIVGRDGPWFLDDHKGRIRHEDDGVRDADRYLLKSPVAAGSKWTAVENLVVQRFEVVATDATAVTRAGTFTRCALVRNEQPLANKGKFVTEWTWAPAVGLVELRTQVVDPAGKAQDQTHLELVSVKLN